MLAERKRSRNGWLSLNHDDTPAVKLPSASDSLLKGGNVFSSRRSSSENVLRGRAMNTTVRVMNIRPVTAR